MQNKAASRRYDYARANIEISGRNAAGLERERCRLRSRGAAKNIETMPSGNRFCSLRTGEICVFGINDIPKMTQITSQGLAQVVCPQAQKTAVFSAGISELEAVLIFAVFLSGLAAGKFWQKPRLCVSRRPTDAPS
jgi:hypothetical protein